MLRPDEFQNDVALKFAVVGHVYLAQSSPGMKLQLLIRLLNDERLSVRIPRTFRLDDRRHAADFCCRGFLAGSRFDFVDSLLNFFEKFRAVHAKFFRGDVLPLR